MENSCIYGSKRIARTGENFGKTTQSTREEIRASFELITRRVSVVTVDVRLTQITGVRRSPFLRTSALSINVSNLDILLKIKLVFKNTDSSFGVLLLLLFYIYSVISASLINIVPFIEAVDKFRNLCLFRYLITVFSSVVCRKLSITCKLRTVLTLLLLTMASIQSVFILFVCLSHRGRLIGVKLVKMPKHKLVRHFSTDRALYSDKARSFSQSERALYRNFIIIKIITIPL